MSSDLLVQLKGLGIFQSCPTSKCSLIISWHQDISRTPIISDSYPLAIQLRSVCCPPARQASGVHRVHGWEIPAFSLRLPSRHHPDCRSADVFEGKGKRQVQRWRAHPLEFQHPARFSTLFYHRFRHLLRRHLAVPPVSKKAPRNLKMRMVSESHSSTTTLENWSSYSCSNPRTRPGNRRRNNR